ncbi:MAG: M28 family peptidase, partial [Gemmatimonadota bacterium]|nr:M28 family peptidase [Gemmatimonadota bacterium]
MRRSWLLPFVLFPAFAACAGSRAADSPAPRGATTAAITPADLRVRASIFAHDSMQGRRTGTPGNVRGNAYITGELARLGLRPAGDSGTYLQQVPLLRYTVDTARATLRAGSARLEVFEEYYPYQAIFEVPVRPIDGAQLLYIGGAADTAGLPPREELDGKLVVFRSEASGNALGAPDLSPQGRLGLIAGIAITQIDPLIANFAQSLAEPQVKLKQDLAVPPGATQPRMLFVPTGSVEALFGRTLDALRPGDTEPAIQGEVAFDAGDVGASNVVAVLEGSDPALRGEYVALGAHNDAIGVVEPVEHDSLRAYNTIMRPRGANDPPSEPSEAQWGRIRGIIDSLRKLRPARLDSIVNGADDDGSGSMGLLEVAEAASRGKRPRRSLLFVWHTGEEAGLHGSRWFTDHATVPRDSIVTQINTDMIARGNAEDEQKGGAGYVQVIGSRRLSTELGDLAVSVNRDGKHGLAFDYTYDADGHPDNFYCRSDHYMYARYGIPIAFFSTGGHRDYHQITDELEYLDFDKFTAVTRFVADLANRVANLDRRPVVDQPKP